ncbi:MAG: hypothetical protein WCV69_03745 [Patescibacteria group bacterium]|jgi:hypothetical protein
MEDKLIDVGFLYPVIDGQIYVGQRGTEPHQGFYGPIGGKSESYNPNDRPYIKEYPAKPHIPYSDIMAKARDKEFGHSSAIREFYEEVFQIKTVPWDEVSNIFKIGAITDTFNDKITNCQFYLAMIDRNSFDLSPRELTNIRPLEEIKVEELYPLAMASLFGLKKVFAKGVVKKLEPYASLNIISQIPDFDNKGIKQIMKNKNTSIEDLMVL